MIFRTIYAICNTWKLRKQLKRYLIDTNLQLQSVRAITAQYLQAQSIRALALDYDGVLASHGEPIPRPEVIDWLHTMVDEYAPNQIYILSNQPTVERIDFFKQNFPQIVFVIPTRKKPYPNGLSQIEALSGIGCAQIMLIDDRLGTGILAATIAGSKARWVIKPYIDLKRAPFAETGFILLRALERTLVAIFPPWALP